VAIQQFDGGKYTVSYDDSKERMLKEIRTPNDVTLGYQYDGGGRLEKVDCNGTYALRFTYDEQGRLTGLSHVPLLKSE